MESVKKGRWTAEELIWLRKNYLKMPKTEIAKKLNRSLSNIYRTAFREVGPIRSKEVEDKLDIVKANYNKMTAVELAQKAGMSMRSLRRYLRNMKLVEKEVKNLWQPKEDQMLRELVSRYCITDLAKRLGRTEHATRRRIFILGLPKPPRKEHVWTVDPRDRITKKDYRLAGIANGAGKAAPALPANADPAVPANAHKQRATGRDASTGRDKVHESQRRYETRDNVTGKVAVRLSQRTTVLMPANYTPDQLATVKAKYHIV